ncbi:MAG TPA: hypothetical protein VKY74_18265 [Chloroflexia bacterium]|nr:hypothetical protein [Chloroflexia bacterium]
MFPDDTKPPRQWAPIEDLDPDPPTGARRGWIGELVLGLGLVLGLVGLGGWQWWQDTGRLSAYRAGAQAAAAHDWDTAAQAYGAAAGYSDATAQAQEARAEIDERATQYQRAGTAQAQGDLLGALDAIRRVQAITPGYRDTAVRGPALQDAVYTAALSGTVALRSGRGPAGLYTYRARGWLFLPGSDAQSRVFGHCPDGALLFDGPAAGTPPARVADLGASPPPALSGRRLLVASPGAPLRAPLALDPDQFQTYICTRTGVWGTSYGGTVPAPRGPGETPIYEVAYQAFDRLRPQVPILPSPAWHVIGLTPDGAHLLLFDASAVTTARWHTRLYLAEPDGTGRRLVLDGNGVPGSAFMADGRYALLDLQQEAPVAMLRQTFQLVDLTGAAPPRLLADEISSPGALGPQPAMQALPVHRPGHSPEVLILTRAAMTQTIQLIDVDHLNRPPLYFILDHSPGAFVLPGVGTREGGLLLGWQRDSDIGSQAVTILYVDPHDQLQVARITLDAATHLSEARVRAGRLLVGMQSWNRVADDAPWPITFSSWPLADLGRTPAGATDFFTGATKGDWRLARQSWYLGPDLLAYVTADGTLHARTYDGHTDLALESGVRGFPVGVLGDAP